MSQEHPEQQSEQTEGPRVMAGQTEDGRVYVVGERAMAVESAPAVEGAADDESERPASVTDQVSQPDKVMRIASMVQKLLDEVKSAELDDPSRKRLGEAYASSIEELKQGLDPELAAELDRIIEPFEADEVPSDGELRIAHAQLVGWLEGLFHGIQTALFAQQMATRAQLEQMRRALPPGQQGGGRQVGPGGPQPGEPGATGQPGTAGPGMYL